MKMVLEYTTNHDPVSWDAGFECRGIEGTHRILTTFPVKRIEIEVQTDYTAEQLAEEFNANTFYIIKE